MSRDDLVTLPRLFRQVVKQLPHMRKSIKGMLIAADKRQDTTVGLGLLLEQAAQKSPDTIAIAHNKSRINYRDFNGWANQIAKHFSDLGLVKGDKVAVCLENRPELLAICAGLAKLGVGAVMINTSQTGHVLLHSLTLVDVSAYVIGDERIKEFQSIRKELKPKRGSVYSVADCDTRRLIGSTKPGYKNLMAEIQGLSKSNPKSTLTIRPSDHCFYIFTSGTTGLPKASIISHGRLMKIYGGFGLSAMHLKKCDVMYVTLPFYHATALVACWAAVLAGPATLAMGRRFSATHFWQEANGYGATVMAYVGELCRYLINAPVSTYEKNNTITKMVGNGLRPAIWQPFKERFGVDEVMELYGSSEGNVGFTNMFNFDNTVGFSPVNYVLVEYDKDTGEPLRNAQGFMTKVGKHGTGLMIGLIDERTPFDGYTNKENSEKAILRNVFKTGDAYFNSGDLLRDLGFNHAQFVDRLGDTFRWKGENVSTTELEGVVSSHDMISECAVYGVEIPKTNGKAGMATLSLADGVTELDGRALYNYLVAELPHYAMPVFLRVTNSLATTGTFKYQKADLKKQGFNIEEIEEPLWVLLPGDIQYQPLTLAIYNGIQDSEYRY
jgi:citronellyl-CoA synthetase